MNSPDAVKKAQIVIGNSIAEMAKVADLVDRFGAEHAIPQRAVDNLNVCLDELLNNTISYGYSDQKAHEITVELSLVDGVAADRRRSATTARRSIRGRRPRRRSTAGSAASAFISSAR